MRQRVGESDEDFRKRQRDYKATWRTTKRTKNAEGVVISKTQQPAPTLEPRVIPDALLKRTTTLTNAQGEAILQWAREEPDAQRRALYWQAFGAEIIAKVKPLPAIIPPVTKCLSDCITGYPVGDQHMGLLAWKHEVGASWDLDIAESMLCSAIDYLVGQSPQTETCIIPFLGDFGHYDGEIPQTPHGKNPLDADGRYFKMVRASRRCMQYVIETAAEKHNKVIVVISPGNHDPFSTVWMQELFATLYAKTPRIDVRTSPSPYQFVEFGKNLIGITHGDLCKPEALGEIMSADAAEAWGRTNGGYRCWWTGHVHNKRVFDGRGWTFESFRVLPPTDAWAFRKGYRSLRNMHSITLHKDGGEIERRTFSPHMIGGK